METSIGLIILYGNKLQQAIIGRLSCSESNSQAGALFRRQAMPH